MTSGQSTEQYLKRIGVAQLSAATCPFDPGYDPVTVCSHLEQSAHLMSALKISMACWMIAEEKATRDKIAAASRFDVPTVAGGGPFEVAVAQGELPAYLDLCADVGLTRIECGEGFTNLPIGAGAVVELAAERSLGVEFELGKKHGGSFGSRQMRELIDQGQRWLDAGACSVVVEARESAASVGLFDAAGHFNPSLADTFAEAFGLHAVVFEAPTKQSQFALLDHFGPSVRLANVRLEELLRVEIYRRGLHSDAFARANLRPRQHTDSRHPAA